MYRACAEGPAVAAAHAFVVAALMMLMMRECGVGRGQEERAGRDREQ
ncbi:MAG: hypothetical protein ACRELF_28060 [Gemmataceae bacterium]